MFTQEYQLEVRGVVNIFHLNPIFKGSKATGFHVLDNLTGFSPIFNQSGSLL